MTAAGSFDVTGMTSTPATTAAATGRSINDEAGGDYVVATTSVGSGAIDTCYSFNAGTDFSELMAPGPFSATDATATGASGTTPFSLFDGANFAVCIDSSQLVGNEFTFDQAWTYGATSLATLGIAEGSYAVTDANTGVKLTLSAQRFGACCAAGAASCEDDVLSTSCTSEFVSEGTCSDYCVGRRFCCVVVSLLLTKFNRLIIFCVFYSVSHHRSRVSFFSFHMCYRLLLLTRCIEKMSADVSGRQRPAVSAQQSEWCAESDWQWYWRYERQSGPIAFRRSDGAVCFERCSTVAHRYRHWRADNDRCHPWS
jgi:hypothetical protein